MTKKMMKNYNLFLPFFMVAVLSSCGVQYESARVKSTSMTPDEVRLELDMSNFELLGETEVSVGYRTYLGFISCLDSVNHQAYNRRQVQKVALKGHKDFCLPRYLNRAAYKVIDAFPTADYYVPMYTRKNLLRMFLGRQTEQSIVIKAYKLK